MITLYVVILGSFFLLLGHSLARQCIEHLEDAFEEMRVYLARVDSKSDTFKKNHRVHCCT